MLNFTKLLVFCLGFFAFSSSMAQSQIDLPVTFDAANVNYTMTDFGGTVTSVVADPMNAANMVGMTVKDATAQTWAGTTIGTNLGFANVIPFTATNRSMSVRVYSPRCRDSCKIESRSTWTTYTIG